MLDTPVNEPIGRYLMHLRNEHRLSVGAIAALTGLSANTIRWIERGVTQPKPESLKALAAALQVTYEDLLVRAGYLERTELTEDERELLRRYTALSVRARAVLLDLLSLMEQLPNLDSEQPGDRTGRSSA